MTMCVNTEVVQRLDVMLTELVDYVSPEVCDGYVMSLLREAKELSGEITSPLNGGLLLASHASHYGHGHPVANAEVDKCLS